MCVDTDMRIDMCIAMRIGMCIDMRIRMYIDMRIDMCMDMRIDMCMDMHIDMCINMCVGLCKDTYLEIRMYMRPGVCIHCLKAGPQTTGLGLAYACLRVRVRA